MSENFASASAPFSMFQSMELTLNRIIGAIDKANTAADLLRQPDGMSPEESSMFSQMREHDVDCVAPVPRRTAFWTAPPERTGKSAYHGTYVLQFRGSVSPVRDPSFSPARFFSQAEHHTQFGKEFRSSRQPVGDSTKIGTVTFYRFQDPAHPLESLAHGRVIRRGRQECLQRTRGLEAAIIQSQPRQIERKSVARCIGRIVENPLGQCTDDGDSGYSRRQPLFLADLALPAKQPGAGIVNIMAETMPQVPSQGAELAAQLRLAEQGAQPVMALLQQIFADIAEKVKVTGQNGNPELKFLAELLGRFGHGTAQIANNGAGLSKMECCFPQSRKDGVGSFRRYLPGTKHPVAPTSEGNQQSPSSIFAGSINVQWPTAVCCKSGPERTSRGVMQPFEIHEKPVAQHADFAARERDSMIGCKGGANFLPLPVMQETLEPDVDYDVVTYDTAHRNQARKSAHRFFRAAAGRAHAHGLAYPKRTVLESYAGTFPCLSHSRPIAANRAALRCRLGIDPCAGDTLRAAAALLLQIPNRLPQARDFGQRHRPAVFFTS